MSAAFCPACGAGIAPGAERCGACGHHVASRTRPSAADISACDRCASLLAPGARFCPACGEAAPAAATPPAPATAAEDAPPAGMALFAPSGGPAAPSGAPMVPRAPSRAGPATAIGLSVPEAAPEAPEPPAGPGFVTYDALPAPTPPHAKSAFAEDPAPPPPAARAAPPPPAPAAPPAADVLTPLDPAPRRRRERGPVEWSDGRLVAIAITAVLLLGSVVAALVLSRGGSDTPEPAAARAGATATPAVTPKRRAAVSLRRQVLTLAGLMRVSQTGRRAAVNGDTKAAVASRARLLSDLQGLRARAQNGRLHAGLTSFSAAIRESLRQNRECPAGCPQSALDKVKRLKDDALAKLNPLLRRYAHRSYRAQDI